MSWEGAIMFGLAFGAAFFAYLGLSMEERMKFLGVLMFGVSLFFTGLVIALSREISEASGTADMTSLLNVAFIVFIPISLVIFVVISWFAFRDAVYVIRNSATKRETGEDEDDA